MLKVYLSHPIRGSLKDNATPESMKANCDLAKGIAGRIKQYMEFNHPGLDLELYVPAEHEAFVNRSWSYDMLTVQQILYIDCKIIEEEFKDVLLIFAPYGPPVEGCHVELQHARKKSIPVIIFKDMSEFKEKIEVYLEDNDYE